MRELSIAEQMSSSALEDVINNAMVQEAVQREKRHPVKEIPKCTEAEIFQYLHNINPNIQSLEDIKAIVPNNKTI